MRCPGYNGSTHTFCAKAEGHASVCADSYGRWLFEAPSHVRSAPEGLAGAELDRLRELAAALDLMRTQRIEQRAAELYAQGASMPDNLADVAGDDWAAFAAVVARKLDDPSEELEAIELAAEMQQA